MAVLVPFLRRQSIENFNVLTPNDDTPHVLTPYNAPLQPESFGPKFKLCLPIFYCTLKMLVAVEGCSHGELDAIYREVKNLEQQRKFKIDVLICCGDFQAVRSFTDLECMAVPPKYRRMQDFYKYYTGEKVASVLTIFIGGNHEASNHLQELHYGGWAAPNIYYLGAAGCIVVNGALRIAGLSGIFKQYHYLNGHFEMPPYDNNTCRSVYHYRNLEIFRLRLLTGNIDVMLSHDWPAGIYNYGNPEYLVRKKPFFRADMEKGELGGWPTMKLLHTMQPRYWFSAHLHVSFRAMVKHNDAKSGAASSSVQAGNPTENAGSSTTSQTTTAKDTPARVTQFQALDKCLPRRHYLEVFEISSVQSSDDCEAGEAPQQFSRIEYDLEWLAVLKSTNDLLSIKNNNTYMPATPDALAILVPSPSMLADIKQAFNGDLEIKPEWFYRSVAPHPGDGNKRPPFIEEPSAVVNEQTTRLCSLLNITDPLRALRDEQQSTTSAMGLPAMGEILFNFVDEEDTVELPAVVTVATDQMFSTNRLNCDKNVTASADQTENESLFSDAAAEKRKPAGTEPDIVPIVVSKIGTAAGRRPGLVLPPPVHVTVENIEFSEDIPA